MWVAQGWGKYIFISHDQAKFMKLLKLNLKSSYAPENF